MSTRPSPLHVVARKPRISFSRLRMAVRLYSSPYVSREQNKRNRREWLRAVQVVGNAWILAGGKPKWGTKSKEGA